MTKSIKEINYENFSLACSSASFFFFFFLLLKLSFSTVCFAIWFYASSKLCKGGICTHIHSPLSFAVQTLRRVHPSTGANFVIRWCIISYRHVNIGLFSFSCTYTSILYTQKRYVFMRLNLMPICISCMDNTFLKIQIYRGKSLQK